MPMGQLVRLLPVTAAVILLTAATPRPTPRATAGAIAIQLLIDNDASGVTGALAQSALDWLKTNPSTAARATLLHDVQLLALSARQAKSPAELLRILDSETGRRYALTTRVQSWNSAIVRFSPTRLDQVEERGVQQLRLSLIWGTTPIQPPDVEPLLAALSGSSTPVDVGQTILRLLPASEPVVGARLVASLFGGPIDENAATAFSKTLTEMATSQLKERTAELLDVSKQRGQALPAATLDFQSLMHGDVSTRTVLAGAGLLELIATKLGSPGLGQDIGRAQHQVRATMEICEGIKLLGTAGAGGAGLAAFSILAKSAQFGPQTENSQNAELLAALSTLTAMVQREFSRVNMKLDGIVVALDDISRELHELKYISTSTQSKVIDLQSDMRSLLSALPEFEQSLKLAVLNADETSCSTFRKGQATHDPDLDLFNKCLELYQLMAVQRLDLSGLGLGADQSKDLINSFPAGGTKSTYDLWPNASVLAKGATAFLGLPNLQRYSDRVTAKRLSSGAFMLQGIDQYLSWINRYGGSHFAKGELHTDSETLRSILADATLQDDFRTALLPPAGTRSQLMRQFAGSIGDIQADEGYLEAVARIREAARTAVTQYTLKARVTELKAAQTPLPAAPIHPCLGGNQAYGMFLYTGEELVAKGMPENALRFGQRAGDGYVTTGGGLIDTPSTGLSICMDVIKAEDVAADYGYVIKRAVSVVTSFEFADHQMCQLQRYDWFYDGTTTAQKRPAPDTWQMIRTAALEGVKQCFASLTSQQREEWFGELPDAYIATGEDEYVAAAVGMASGSKAIQPADIDIVVRQTAARLSFLRGYLLFAYPSVSALGPASLDREIFQRDLSSDRILAGFACYANLERARRAKGESSTETDLRFSNGCGETPLVLSVGDLLNFGDRAKAMADQLQATLGSIDWDAANNGDLSQTSWVGTRLRQFLETGNTAAYWNALPKRGN